MYKKTDYLYQKSGLIFNQHFYWTKQPTEVIIDFIKKFSKEGDVVLDPFCGTSTVGLIGMEYNCSFIGIDGNEDYIKESKNDIGVIRRKHFGKNIARGILVNLGKEIKEREF